jgi:hypothetical protein
LFWQRHGVHRAKAFRNVGWWNAPRATPARNEHRRHGPRLPLVIREPEARCWPEWDAEDERSGW